MVAKGLDFPLVSLVGIVNADLGLKMPFYDAYEKHMIYLNKHQVGPEGRVLMVRLLFKPITQIISLLRLLNHIIMTFL